MATLRSLVVKVGADLSDFQKKMSHLTKEINKVGKNFKTVGDAMTKGITVPVLGAAAALTGIAIKSGKAADELITLANQTGLSTEALQEMQYAARFVDVEVETMTGSMIKLTKNMDMARRGSKEQEEAFAKLGVEYKNVDGTLRNAKDVWADTIDALGNMSNEAERDATALSLFGRSAADLNPLIKAGGDEMKRLAAEAHEVGAVMSGENISRLGKFDDSMEKLKATVGNAAASIGVAFLPVLEKLMPIIQNQLVPLIGKFADFVGKVIEKFDALSPGMQKTIIAAIALAVAIGPVLSVVGKAITAVGTFTKVLSLVASPAGLIIIAILAIAAAVYLVIKNWEKISAFFVKLWDDIKNIFKKAVDFIKNVFLNFTWLGLIIKHWDAIMEFFKGIPNKMLQVGRNIVEGLWNGIKNAGEWIKQKISGYVDGVVGGIKKFFGIGSPSKLMAEEVGKWIPKGISVGISANAGSVEDAISDINTDMTANLGSANMLNLKQNNGMAAGATRPNINITIENPYIMDDYGVDKMVNRITQRLKLQGVTPY